MKSVERKSDDEKPARLGGTTKKHHRDCNHNGALLELLSRFELETSSLPRMRSTD